MMIIKFILYGLLGLCLGSFFNVVQSRDDWKVGRSRCDNCGHILSWYELIPIISFICLKGKCKECKTKIDIYHIVAEMFSLIGFIVFAMLDFNVVTLITIVVLVFNAIMDYKTRMVDTRVTYSGIGILLLIRILQYWKAEFFWSYALLLFLTAVIFYLSSMVFEKYIGDGDFDIAFFLILSLGYLDFLNCIFYASLIGVGYAIIKRLKPQTAIPLVPLFYFGYLTTLLL